MSVRHYGAFDTRTLCGEGKDDDTVFNRPGLTTCPGCIDRLRKAGVLTETSITEPNLEWLAGRLHTDGCRQCDTVRNLIEGVEF